MDSLEVVEAQQGAPERTITDIPQFGTFVKELRRQRGITQAELEKVGINHHQQVELEKNQFVPKTTEVKRLAFRLNQDPDGLELLASLSRTYLNLLQSNGHEQKVPSWEEWTRNLAPIVRSKLEKVALEPGDTHQFLMDLGIIKIDDQKKEIPRSTPKQQEIIDRLSQFPYEIVKRRAERLDEIFEHRRWIWNPQLLMRREESIEEVLRELKKMFPGGSWHFVPSALGKNPEGLTVHVKEVDRILGSPKWRDNHAILVSISQETLAERANWLTGQFGNDGWKTQPGLLAKSPDLLSDRIRYVKDLFGVNVLNSRFGGAIQQRIELTQSKCKFLNEMFGGDNWKRNPTLLTRNEDSIREHAAFLTQLFADKWKKYPQLFGLSKDNLLKKARLIERLTGSYNWQEAPDLFDKSTRTLEANIRLLLAWGIDPFKDRTTRALLYTTTEKKREKAGFIRREILQHNFVFNDKSERKGLGDDQKRELREEIDEFREVIRKNPALLLMSLDALKARKEELSNRYGQGRFRT